MKYKKFIGEIVKNQGQNHSESIRILAEKTDEKNIIDLRVWFKQKTGEGFETYPTKSGFSFSPELLPDILRALEKTQNFIDWRKLDDKGKQAGQTTP